MLLKVPLIYSIIHRNVSALYVTGDKATQNYAVLTPYFDFNTKFHNREKLEQNIKHRKMNIDLEEVQLLWSTFKDIELKKSNLEKRRIEIANLLKNIDRNTSGSEDLCRKFKSEGILVRDDLKSLKENSYAFEETFIHKFLSLPNDLHERTPIENDEVYCSHFDHLKATDGENHLNKVNCVDYYDPSCYYLKGEAAKLDLNLPHYCLELFKSYGFLPFSNPDFIRSIMAEGAGLNTEELLLIHEEDIENKLNLLHLTGSGSMLSFLGFVTKLFMYKTYLPLKFISIGKEFAAPKLNSNETGLYSVCQTTNAQLFAISKDEKESLQQFDETVEQIIEFYKIFKMPFRVTYVSGAKLNQAENLRANFEMYSPHRKCYIPIGNLCSYGDYISKRLLISYREEKFYKFPVLISGNIINVTKLLAILLERNGNFENPIL